MKYFFYIILFLISKNLISQTNLFFTKKTLKIGEQCELILELNFDKKDGTINYLPFANEIPCYKKAKNGSIDSITKYSFEIIGKFSDSINYSHSNKLKWLGKYTVTMWDSGNYILPAFTIEVGKETYYFPATSIRVFSPKVDEKKDIYDIREDFAPISDLNKKWYQNPLTYWILFGLIGISLLVYFLWKRYKKSKLISIPEIEKSLLDRTQLALELLINKKYWENNLMKEHYMEFSFILRTYLSEKYSINLLEKTSFESYLLLKQKNVPLTYLETFKNLLDVSDLVKFAKTIPNSMDVLNHANTFKNILCEIENETNLVTDKDV